MICICLRHEVMLFSWELDVHQKTLNLHLSEGLLTVAESMQCCRYLSSKQLILIITYGGHLIHLREAFDQHCVYYFITMILFLMFLWLLFIAILN